MKTIDADGSGSGAAVDTECIYDGGHILLAFDDDGDLTNRYLHGPVVDMILADEEVTTTSADGDIHWPLADNLGSVRDIVQSTYKEPIDDAEHLFVFADGQYELQLFAIRLPSHERGNPIIILDGGPPTTVADSFSHFVELYLTNPDRLRLVTD